MKVQLNSLKSGPKWAKGKRESDFRLSIIFSVSFFRQSIKLFNLQSCRLCIAIHCVRRLGWSCMLMYSHVLLCIAMHGGRRLGCSLWFMYSHVWLCIAMHGSRSLGW